MSTSTQRTASVEVGVPRAEQDHRQRGATAQLGAEMRDTTRLVGGRAAGSTTTLFSPGERVRRGTSLRWRLMERSWRSGLSHDQGSVAGARTDGQRVIASHVCYSNSTNSRGDSDDIPAGMNGETGANDGQPVKCFQQFQPSQRIFTRTDEHYITFANVANIVFFRMILLKGHIVFGRTTYID